ncbi:hypothetical protein HYT55_04370 [Candidatus Woesearchaeota archaeon]|nr:hypothetical protein [Candidatus Woesearchaeota archaeon]
MVTLRGWVVMNFSLGLIILLLGLYLAGVTIPSLGQAATILDRSAPVCIVEWNDDFVMWDDLDHCCLEARKQLSCEREKRLIGVQEVTEVCTTGRTSVKFHFNEKAYSYCQRQVIWS